MNPASFDPDIVRPLLAGWILGAALGLIETALVVIAVARSPRWPEQLSYVRVSLPAFMIAAANGMLIGWTLIGLLFGAISIVAPMPNFSVAVIIVFGGVALLYSYVRGLGRRGEATLFIGSTLMAIVAFAVLLPFLSSLR